MLLTVIAVATLLVAVVGATFAYFSLSTSGSESTTTGTVTTSKIGSIAFTSDTTDLTLSVSGQDMLKGSADKTYYAVKGAVDSGSHGTQEAIEIAKVELSGAKTGDTYTCKNNTLTVTPSGNMLTELAKHADSKWVQLAIDGTMVTPKTIDFSSDEGQEAVTVTVPDITFTDNGTKNITAVLSLVNKVDAVQDDIAEKTLSVEIKFTPGTCELTSSAS